MWQVTSTDVFTRRSPGGDKFVEFVDAVLTSLAQAGNIQGADIKTNLRTNKADGGVDTELISPATPDPSGWLAVPTCWQHKATEANAVDYVEEIQKPYCKELILKGYGYRLAICDDIPATVVKDWEDELLTAAKAINPNASPPRVVCASDLARIASQFPAVVLRFFRPGMGPMLHLRAWYQSISSATPKYVAVAEWEAIKSKLANHCDFTKSTDSAVFPLQGESGVGKTRLVCEMLRGTIQGEPLAIYTTDEQSALSVSNHLANDADSHALLIVDECSLPGRLQLEATLRGHTNRIRAIAISNTGPRPMTGSGEPWLERIPGGSLDAILSENFPLVPQERRRAYAGLAEGFVRLAADLCSQDNRITSEGHLGPVFGALRDYLNTRFTTDDDLKVVHSLSLFTKVGYKDPVAAEITAVSALTNTPRDVLLDRARRFKDSPGFVGFSHQYLHITPEVIASIAFDGAWRRWAEMDPGRFIRTIPDLLLEQFQQRVSRSAREEVRRVVGEHFRTWASSLIAGDLSNASKCIRLVTLIDTDPSSYLPILRTLVTTSTEDQLKAGSTDALRTTRNPRRNLVWLAERLVAFPEYFEDAETILLHLAIAESEPDISNNATGVWKQLFRPYLSGTAIPFEQRLKLLEHHILGTKATVTQLGLQALERTIDFRHASRGLGPAVVAGRIPPPDWRPVTVGEERDCAISIAALLLKLAKSDRKEIAQSARESTLKHLHHLLWENHLDTLMQIFDSATLSDRERAWAIQTIETFLNRDALEDKGIPSEYLDKVRGWLNAIAPADYHSQLVRFVGVDPWHHSDSDSEKQWKGTLSKLASTLISDGSLLQKELPWLSSQEAKSSAVLGEQLGIQDKVGVALDHVFQAVAKYRSTNLARGYVYGLTKTSTTLLPRVNAAVDVLTPALPLLAFDIYRVAGRLTRSFERTLTLVDDGRLPLEVLSFFSLGLDGDPLTTNEFQAAISRLLKASKAGSLSAWDKGTEFVDYRIKEDIRKGRPSILKDDAVRELVWDLVSIELQDQRSGWHWKELVAQLSRADANRAAKVACDALGSPSYQLRLDAQQLVTLLVKEHAEGVFPAFCAILQDRDRAPILSSENLRNIVSLFPAAMFRKWLEGTGAEGARVLAPHLPRPHLDDNHKPVVPELTEYVLATYEDDEKVFKRFLSGFHGGELVWGGPEQRLKDVTTLCSHFKGHKLRRIREWASSYERSARNEAEWWETVKDEDP